MRAHWRGRRAVLLLLQPQTTLPQLPVREVCEPQQLIQTGGCTHLSFPLLHHLQASPSLILLLNLSVLFFWILSTDPRENRVSTQNAFVLKGPALAQTIEVGQITPKDTRARGHTCRKGKGCCSIGYTCHHLLTVLIRIFTFHLLKHVPYFFQTSKVHSAFLPRKCPSLLFQLFSMCVLVRRQKRGDRKQPSTSAEITAQCLVTENRCSLEIQLMQTWLERRHMMCQAWFEQLIWPNEKYISST